MPRHDTRAARGPRQNKLAELARALNTPLAVVLVCAMTAACTSAPQQTPVKEVQVQSSDPVARTYAVDEAEIGGAEALSTGPVIEGLSLDPSGGTTLGRAANGDIIYLSRFENNVLLANYWSSACNPCWRRMLEVQQVYDDYQTYGLVIVNINYGDTAESANAYIDAKGRNFTMMQLTDPTGQAAGALGVSGVPTTILFDRNGREVMRYGEISNADKIRQDLDLLLK